MLRSRASLSFALRRLSSCVTPIMTTNSNLLPADTLLEEETNPDYDPRRFYPARVGETIQKYNIISKLGWGSSSTVWLAKDVNRSVTCASRLYSINRLQLAMAIEPICCAQNHQLL